MDNSQKVNKSSIKPVRIHNDVTIDEFLKKPQKNVSLEPKVKKTRTKFTLHKASRSSFVKPFVELKEPKNLFSQARNDGPKTPMRKPKKETSVTRNLKTTRVNKIAEKT